MNRSRTSTAARVAALVAATTAVGIAAPAHADYAVRTDPQDSAHGSDLLELRVAHRAADVVVASTHRDLRRSPASGSGGAVFYDTDPADRGPEFVLVGGWFAGTDYVLLETEGFATKQWGEPVEAGTYRQRIAYRADRVVTVVSRESLGDPDQVRVAVRASGPSGDVDWVGAPGAFTGWLDRA